MSLFLDSNDLENVDHVRLTGSFIIPTQNISTVEYRIFEKITKKPSESEIQRNSWRPEEPQYFKCTTDLLLNGCFPPSYTVSIEDVPDTKETRVIGYNGPFEINNITKEDFELIYRKWRYIRHDLVTFSSLLLRKLGTTLPGIITKLNTPADPKKYETVVQNQECLKRVLHLSEYLDKILVNLESPDSIYNIIYDMAGPHGKLFTKPLTKEDVQGLTSAVVDVVTRNYKSDNSLQLYQAYEKVLKIIFSNTEDFLHWDDFHES